MSLHILALETSSAWCGVALLRASDGEPVHIEMREHQGVQEHSARLIPMIDEVLAAGGVDRSAIDAIAFGQGPGGFTGLRVACGVAQGLGFALERPVVPVVSHAAVAVQLEPQVDQVVVVAMDARMQEVYLSAFRWTAAGDLLPLYGPQLMATQGLEAWVRQSLPVIDGKTARLLVAGDAMDAYPDAFPGLLDAERGPSLRPTAAGVAVLAQRAFERGEAIAPDLAMPLYVRDKVAFTTAERTLGAGGNPRVATPTADGAA
jgi:tRNA threonylcarbamoyladenosine biosynthesis protein TsaB